MLRKSKYVRAFVYPQTLKNYSEVFKMIRTQFTVWRSRKDRESVSRVSHGKYLCEGCKAIVGRKERQYDHIRPIGNTPKVPEDSMMWTEEHFRDVGQWFLRVFCNVNNIQCLCLTCHKAKTAKEMSGGQK